MTLVRLVASPAVFAKWFHKLSGGRDAPATLHPAPRLFSPRPPARRKRFLTWRGKGCLDVRKTNAHSKNYYVKRY
jgi:hypothetical protein